MQLHFFACTPASMLFPHPLKELSCLCRKVEALMKECLENEGFLHVLS